jgi:predicted AAA+ superfamily ATPase
MIPRQAAEQLRKLARGFPVLSITGPRQSGKTTLARACFPDLPHANLESPADRSFADQDPLGFLARFPDGAILDEIQHCPHLFSYLQVRVDEDGAMGRFVITGSQQFGLNARIAQSLAGRVGAVTLLPFSLDELAMAGRKPASLDTVLWQGFYPPLYDRPVDPGVWYDNYERTYLERDLRQLSSVQDLSVFQRFLRLCAGRTGQLVNFSALASDVGVSPNTVRNWLSILEASYVVRMLPPHHRNFNKRLVKSPKLYFLDPGLAASLLGITAADQLATHPLRGALFETLVFCELVKTRLNAGKRADLSFWRDNHGREVDFLCEDGGRLHAIEAKSALTVTPGSLKGLLEFARIAESLTPHLTLIHGGEQAFESQGASVRGWSMIADAMGPTAH